MIGAYLLGVATAAAVALLGYALARAAASRLEPEHNTDPLTLPAPSGPPWVDHYDWERATVVRPDVHPGQPCTFDQDDGRACRCGVLDLGVVPKLVGPVSSARPTRDEVLAAVQSACRLYQMREDDEPCAGCEARTDAVMALLER